MEIAGANNSNIGLVQNSDPASTKQAMANRDLVRAVNTVNAAKAFGSSKEITFQMDAGTKTPVIRIIDKETNQVVDQIPAEYILQLAASLGATASNPSKA
jgi:uncharacterized FlaG/YvyC family protein